ncbi:PadR family transcriptional regulator [Saccharopolyspora spinosa]|uniref:PadR family transcriptional regulator n=1 Tax=Saccharopolyspora spinosa TaxID=60894 RepID=A0A2N3Y3T6_SACSN|nr:PadR family transcriptional regulator [Saccharopolyspora spinosa]PKW17481.1 PadR family transcriptional regulator [Saccharopolyspora spinosa]
MSLEYAILVSLQERAGSGYELARRFDKSIGYFWAASHQQIYRSLKRMVELDWVSCDEVAQDKRPDKKVYRVGEAGAAELARWLAKPVDPPTIRNELSVKIRGACVGDVDGVVEEVARHRQLHSQRLAAFRALERRDFPAPEGLSGQQLHQHLVLRGGILSEEAMVSWLDEALTVLRADLG